MSPWRAILAATQPTFGHASVKWFEFDSTNLFLAAAAIGALLLNVIAIVMVRRWNPTREAAPAMADERDGAAGTTPANVHSAGGKARPVWDNPILWREIRTWAYGKKILLVRIAYWTVFLVSVAVLVTSGGGVNAGGSQIVGAAQSLVALLVVSLILLNAAAVTSLTNERDAKALDLLLDHGSVAEGDRVRQAGRRVFQRQGNGAVSAAAVRLSVVRKLARHGTVCVSMHRLVRDGRVCRDAGAARGNYVRQLADRHRHEPRHVDVLVSRNRDVHENHAGVQQLVQLPADVVSRLHRGRQRGTLCRAGLAESVAGDFVGRARSRRLPRFT